jgi:hypothetical protein
MKPMRNRIKAASDNALALRRSESSRGVAMIGQCGLTKKAEPPPTCDANRDSGTDSANGGWLRRLVRQHRHTNLILAAYSKATKCPSRLWQKSKQKQN